MNKKIWIPSAVPFFLFGFFYYLITPYISLSFFADNPILLVAHNFIDISFFDCLIIISAWIMGYKLIQKIKFKKLSLDKIVKFKIAPFTLGIILMLFLFFLVLSAKGKGTIFSSGYSNYDISVLGPFATMLFISVWFINYFQRKDVKILFISIFLVLAVLMLGLGLRIFFVLGISLILATLSVNKKILNSPLFYLFLFGLLGLVITVGNGFKFYDYFLSVGRENENPLIINQDTNIEIIISHFKKYEISIDLDKLINVCPFRINL